MGNEIVQDEGRAIPPAGLTGRVGKLIVGILQLWGSVSVVRHFGSLTDMSSMGQPAVWIFVALGIWLFPFAVNLGFQRVFHFGYRPLWIALVVAVPVAGFGLFQSGTVWAPPTAAYLLGLAVYVHTHVGVSHILASLVGIPGCEMRILPYLLAKWRRDPQAQLCLCPGMWTPIDRWEARLRKKRQMRGTAKAK